MLTTLAFVAALGLAPSQAGKLDLTNVRPTYGMLGTPRPDTKFLPGDVFFLCFDIENLKVADDGKVTFGMSIEATDAKGKVWYKDDKTQAKVQAVNYLGGTRLPGYANLMIGQDMPPGDYTLKVTVNDLAAKASKELVHKFQVLPPDFGLVRLMTLYDEGGLPCPMTAVPMQGMYVHWVCVGFERDKAKKQPNVAVEMRILDAAGKPTLPKPFPGEVTDADEKLRAVDMGFGMILNRPGNFTFEVKATDNVAKKTVTLRFPLTVLPNDGKAAAPTGGKLDLTNAHPTYGVLGARRPDTKFLPGDTLFLAYDIENLKMSDLGVVYYGIAMEVSDAKGKVHTKDEKSQKLTLVKQLGGATLCAQAFYTIPFDLPPGEYNFKITVTDRAAKASKDLTYKFEVLPAAFGLIGLITSYEVEGRVLSPMLGAPGQWIHVHWAATGFDRDKATKMPKLTCEARILDDAGKPTLPKPFPITPTEVDPKQSLADMAFPISLNRPGKFTVEITATDNLSKKKTKLTFPLTVLPNYGKGK